VGLRAGLDWCGISRPHWDSIPGPSGPYTDRAIPAHNYLRVIILSANYRLPLPVSPFFALAHSAVHLRARRSIGKRRNVVVG